MSTSFNSLAIDFPFLIGPMVGISHLSYRKLIRKYTPPHLTKLIFTEMLSSKRIPQENFATSQMARFEDFEPGLIIQLLGNQEEYLAKSIERLSAFAPWGFDINMGCPARQILKHNFGVELMNDPSLAANIVTIAKKHAPNYVSVKMRGVSTEEEEISKFLNFAKALEDAGADWLTLHARPRSQKHKGEANWNLGHLLANHVGIPVVLNGGIQTSSDAISLLHEHKVAGIMLARAAVARPWILWQIAEDLGHSFDPFFEGRTKAPRGPLEEGAEFITAVIHLLKLLCEDFSCEKFITERMSFYCATAAPWLQFGHALWKLTTQTTKVSELETKLEEFKANCPNPMCSTIKFWN